MLPLPCFALPSHRSFLSLPLSPLQLARDPCPLSLSEVGPLARCPLLPSSSYLVPNPHGLSIYSTTSKRHRSGYFCSSSFVCRLVAQLCARCVPRRLELPQLQCAQLASRNECFKCLPNQGRGSSKYFPSFAPPWNECEVFSSEIICNERDDSLNPLDGTFSLSFLS